MQLESGKLFPIEHSRLKYSNGIKEKSLVDKNVERWIFPPVAGCCDEKTRGRGWGGLWGGELRKEDGDSICILFSKLCLILKVRQEL